MKEGGRENMEILSVPTLGTVSASASSEDPDPECECSGKNDGKGKGGGVKGRGSGGGERTVKEVRNEKMGILPVPASGTARCKCTE